MFCHYQEIEKVWRYFKFVNLLNININTIRLSLFVPVALILQTISASSWATEKQPSFTQFTAYYKIMKAGISVGETKRSVESINDDTFIFKSETNPGGFLSWISDAYVMEQSIWKLNNNDMRPLEYTYKNTNDNKTRTVQLLFDWHKNRVTNIINGDPWHMKLVPGLLDKLLYQLKMMQDLINGNRELKYAVADGGRIKDYAFNIMGEETLETDLGRFSTLKLKRTTDIKTTTWWCVEQLAFLPIKIQREKKDGSRVTAILHKLEGIPLPANTSGK